MKESKCRQEQLFYEERCSVQLLGVCSACFLKLGHMLLWMVGFKWEKTDAVNSGTLTMLSQNAIKMHKLLK